jgi:hypothetical protein
VGLGAADVELSVVAESPDASPDGDGVGGGVVGGGGGGGGGVLLAALLVGAGAGGVVGSGAVEEGAGALVPDAEPLGSWPPVGLLVSPGELLPGDVVPADVVPGDVVPGDVVPGEVVPGDVVPEDVPPGDVVPGDVVPGELVPGELVPGVVPPGAVVPGELVPGLLLPGAVVPNGPVVVPFWAELDRAWVRGGVSAVGATDGGGEPSGIASPTGVIPVPGTAAGTGGNAAVAGPVATRTAPAYPLSHIVVTSTNSPGCGACTSLPSPRYIATWCTVARSRGSYAQNSRSPGSRSGRSTAVPTRACSREVRGSATPAIAYERCTSPEQSYESGPVAPHTYGLPTWSSAYLIATETACGAASVVPWPSADGGMAAADGGAGAADAVRVTIEVAAADRMTAARRSFSRLSSRSRERRCSAGSRTVQPGQSSPEPPGWAASRTTVGAARWSDVAAPSTAIVPTEMAPTAVQRQIAHQPGNP